MRKPISRCGAGLALLGLIAAQAAWAQPGNLEKAVRIVEQQARTGRGEFITYLNGAAAAYRWVNTTDRTDGQRSMYCPPADVVLEPRSYARIALEEYQRGKSEYTKLPQYPLDVLSLALLRGLGQRFPCKSEELAPSAKGQSAFSEAEGLSSERP
jgi:hypothetical protein